MVRCFCCETDFPFGPNVYFGRHLAGYEITVCDNCYNANSAGWQPYYAVRILTHLRRLGIEIPARNVFGSLPRDWPAKAA